MRTINVKSDSTRIQILEQVSTALENDILDDKNSNGSFDCSISDDKVFQYELDSEGEIFNEVVWYVNEINEDGLSSAVEIDC